MKTANVLLGAVAGTAAMILFSHFLSDKKDREFKEPELLGKMVNRAFPSIDEMPAQSAGWNDAWKHGIPVCVCVQRTSGTLF